MSDRAETIQFLISFVGLSNYLPPTASVKLLDVWMLFAMLYTFLGVILHSVSQVGQSSTYNRFMLILFHSSIF